MDAARWKRVRLSSVDAISKQGAAGNPIARRGNAINVGSLDPASGGLKREVRLQNGLAPARALNQDVMSEA